MSLVDPGFPGDGTPTPKGWGENLLLPSANEGFHRCLSVHREEVYTPHRQTPSRETHPPADTHPLGRYPPSGRSSPPPKRRPLQRAVPISLKFILVGLFFSQKLHENERNWTEGACPSHSLGSANGCRIYDSGTRELLIEFKCQFEVDGTSIFAISNSW